MYISIYHKYRSKQRLLPVELDTDISQFKHASAMLFVKSANAITGRHHISFSNREHPRFRPPQEFFSGELNGGWPLDMNGTLILGQEQDAISDGFDPTQVFGDSGKLSVR